MAQRKPTKRSTNRELVKAYIPRELKSRLTKTAKAKGFSASLIISMALTQYLDADEPTVLKSVRPK